MVANRESDRDGQLSLALQRVVCQLKPQFRAALDSSCSRLVSGRAKVREEMMKTLNGDEAGNDYEMQ
jgi:hypothetical protein